MTKSSRRDEEINTEDFLKTILRSGLLDREQLQTSLRGVSARERDDPEAIANHLIRSGRLSRFQARKLLQGTAMGLVLGPFQVLAPIGKGGMGTVYLARDSRGENQLVALKILPPKKAREEERLLARFRREMELCQRVSHPNLAWTYESGVCQNIFYIAMEYIPGRSLYRLISEQGPMAVPRVARLMSEVAAALDHVHEQGLIHRDLKPSNIHITPHDHAVVLDLGLALIAGETGTDREIIGGEGYVVGTMDYIAPEQIQDATRIDPRADIYSLGASIYYALTGRPPFAGGTALEKLHRHRNEEPTPVHEVNPDVPITFAMIVHKMMAKNLERRYPSAAAVRKELLKWAEKEPALPRDRPGDREYAEAVDSLRSTEPSADLADEVIPVAELVPQAQPVPEAPRQKREKPRSQPSISTNAALPSKAPPQVNRSVKAPPPSKEPGKLVFVILLGIGLFLIGIITLAALVQIWLGR